MDLLSNYNTILSIIRHLGDIWSIRQTVEGLATCVIKSEYEAVTIINYRVGNW